MIAIRVNLRPSAVESLGFLCVLCDLLRLFCLLCASLREFFLILPAAGMQALEEAVTAAASGVPESVLTDN